MLSRAILVPFVAAARVRGVDLELPDVAAVPPEQAAPIVARAAAACGDPWLGLTLTQAMWRSADPRANAMVFTAPSVRAIGATLARGAGSLETNLSFSVTDEGRSVVFRVGARAPHEGETQIILLALASLWLATHALLAKADAVRMVVPGRLASRSASLPFRVSFGAEPAVVLPRAVADARPASANERLFAHHARAFLARSASGPADPPTTTIVRRILTTGGLGLDLVRVAEHARTSSRTLQRRLAAEGASLERIRDDERRAALLALLPRASSAEVARTLGYGDVPALHRAVRRWAGASPGVLRGTLTPVFDRLRRAP